MNEILARLFFRMDDGLFYTETMRLGSLDKIFIVNRRITKCTYIVLITSDLWEIENPRQIF